MKLIRVALPFSLTIALTLLMVVVVTAKPFRSAKGYTITPPANWHLEKSGFMGTDVVFYAQPMHNFAANINVVVTKAPPKANLESGLVVLNAMYPHVFTGYKRLAQGYTSVDGTRAFYNTALQKPGTPPRQLRMHQVVALKNGLNYTFTCTCLATDYAQSSAAFATALKSIRWTK